MTPSLAFLSSSTGSRALRSLALPLLSFGLAGAGSATDLFWDGGTTNIVGNGDGAAAYATGTWNSTLLNWDQGASPHVAWNNGDTAIFGGTYSAGTKTVTVTSAVTVNQIKILTGDAASATSANRYDITSTGVGSITFNGTYSTSTPSIDASAANVRNTNFSAKITGDLSANGGLVIAHGSQGSNPASGRIFFGNVANDFTGDVTMVSGNLHIASNLGTSTNKLILAGGSLLQSAASLTTFARDIHVSANSGFNFSAAGTIADITGAITGSANLTRYSGGSVNELRFSGNMSGFTGLIDNTGTGTTSIQTTATSGGGWRLTGGTVKLNTANDTHIADGAGKSDLLMNGGTLDMNGKSETINGLSGVSGIVQNQLATTSSTLTVGAGNATASYGGTLRNNGGTGGTLAVTKIGDGTQTFSGTSSYTGATLVSAGTLLVNGTLGNTAVTVGSAGTVGGDGIIGGSLHFDADAKFAFSTTVTLTINGSSVTFDNFGIEDLVGLDSSTANGTYTLIDGSAVIDTLNLANLGEENAYDLGDGKAAYFETGSLNVVVVPEPEAALLGGFGLLALLRRRRGA